MKSLREYWRELREKMVRDPLTPNAVASGWALGMFVGCTIPFGMQLIVSVPLAFLLRVSKVGATVGTLVTNPLTILFIYPVQTWVGARLLGSPLSWDDLVQRCHQLGNVSLFSQRGWDILSDIGGRVLGGFFLGGLLLGLVLTPLTYLAVLRIVRRHRRRRAEAANA